MPKLELGDLEGVERLKTVNVPRLAELARAGYAILTAVPSCTLMFKSELPLLFPDDAEVKAASEAGCSRPTSRQRLEKCPTTSRAIRECRTWDRRPAKRCSSYRGRRSTRWNVAPVTTEPGASNPSTTKTP